MATVSRVLGAMVSAWITVVMRSYRAITSKKMVVVVYWSLAPAVPRFLKISSRIMVALG